MKKIAIIVQRYGKEVVGGSEGLAMQYAQYLKAFYSVDVITSTCLNHHTWDNYYPVGESVLDGVNVIRFSTTKPGDYNKSNQATLEKLKRISPVLFAENNDMCFHIAQNPHCPDSLTYIDTHSNDYDAFIFFTYLFYPTVYGIPLVSNKAIFIPTAHDELYIRQGMKISLFNTPRFIVFLTEEEGAFVHSYFQNSFIKSNIAGAGIEVPKTVNPQSFKEKYNIDDKYLIYVGRIEEGKGCAEMVSYFIEYKKANPSALKLVLIGSGELNVPKSEDIVFTGFVDEQTKYDGISGAQFLILPSQYESLSLSLLEAFALGVPALVNGLSEVLKGHCNKSGAGFSYTNVQEFIDFSNRLLTQSETYKKMQKNAISYVKGNYTWELTGKKLHKAISYIVNNPISFDKHIFAINHANKNSEIRISTEKHTILINEELNTLKNANIHYYRDLAAHSRVFSSAIIFFKRAIRKLIKFIGIPIVEEINDYNKRTTNIIALQKEEITRLNSELASIYALVIQENLLQNSTYQADSD